MRMVLKGKLAKLQDEFNAAEAALHKGTIIIQRDSGREYLVTQLNRGKAGIMVFLNEIKGHGTTNLGFSHLMNELGRQNGAWKWK